MRAELGRQLAAEHLDRRQPDLEAAEEEVAQRGTGPAEREDHAGALADHVPRRGPGGDERRAQQCGHGLLEVGQ